MECRGGAGRVHNAPVRLKLTLEYDGIDFYGWAIQPGLRTVEGELREALRQGLPGLVGARGRRPHRHGRARARAGRLGRGRGRTARRAHRGCAQRGATGRRRGRRGGGSRLRLPRSARRSLPQLSLPDLAAPDAFSLRARQKLVAPEALRRGAARRQRARRAGRARLPGVHAESDTAPRLRPNRALRRVAPARRRPRARDHRERLPPPHGAGARRNDGRALTAGARRRCSRRVCAPTQARPPRRGGSTSSGWTTTS